MTEQNSRDGELLIVRKKSQEDLSTNEISVEIDNKEEDFPKKEEEEEEDESEEIFQGQADVVIIDNGSYMVKAGTADKKAPTLEYRCLVGTNIDSKEEHAYPEDIEAGMEDNYKFSCPLDEFGRVKEKTQMGNFWERILKKLPEQEDFKVLLTEPPHELKGINSAQENREKMMTLMEYGVSACYIANEAQLALYSTGKTSGTVVDLGHSMTYVTPIYEGYVLNQAVQMAEFGGWKADEFLKGKISEVDWTKYSTQKHLALIKEKHCKVSLESHVPSVTEESSEEYKLPDNKQILLKKDVLFQTPELFFNPSLFAKPSNDGQSSEQKNINELIYKAVRETPAKIRRSVTDVVLCGSSSMFPGMVERMESVLSERNEEQKNQLTDVTKLTLVAKPYRKYATWIGGSILANLEPFMEKWITKEILDEEGGDRCVHKRIFW
jgi:actin-related protein